MSLGRAVALHLTSLGLLDYADDGGSCTLGMWSDDADQSAAVFVLPGGSVLPGGTRWQQTVLVKVRGKAGEALPVALQAGGIAQALWGAKGTWGGVHVEQCITEPAFESYEARGDRWVWTVRARVAWRPA